MSQQHDDYRPVEAALPQEACPCCGSTARLWEHSEAPEAPVRRVVMCSNSGGIGPRDGNLHDGCLLQMPPDDFYQPTAHGAIRYWTEYARALTAAQRENRWKTAQVLRATQGGRRG